MPVENQAAPEFRGVEGLAGLASLGALAVFSDAPPDLAAHWCVVVAGALRVGGAAFGVGRVFRPAPRLTDDSMSELSFRRRRDELVLEKAGP